MDNQVEVSQSAADDSSPLTCTPECPQSEQPSEYDYEYYGSANTGQSNNGGGSSHGGSNHNNNQGGSSSSSSQEESISVDFIDYPDNSGYTDGIEQFPEDEEELDYSFQAQPRSASPADSLAPGEWKIELQCIYWQKLYHIYSKSCNF